MELILNFGDIVFIYPGDYTIEWDAVDKVWYPMVKMDSGRELHLYGVSVNGFKKMLRMGLENPTHIFEMDEDIYDLEDLDLRVLIN